MTRHIYMKFKDDKFDERYNTAHEVEIIFIRVKELTASNLK